MDPMLVIWLGAVVFFVVVESLTVQMLCIWFAASALVSLVLALLGVPEYIQIIVFFVCTALLLIFTRPIVIRLMRQKPVARTNADRVLHMPAIVTQEINNEIAEGQVKVLNQIWTARSLSGETLPVGSRVVVRMIEGVKVIVEKAQ